MRVSFHHQENKTSILNFLTRLFLPVSKRIRGACCCVKKLKVPSLVTLWKNIIKRKSIFAEKLPKKNFHKVFRCIFFSNFCELKKYDFLKESKSF